MISSVLQPETLLLPSSWALSSALSSFWINIFLFTLLYLGNEGSYQKTVKSGPPLIFRARRIGDGPAADFCQTKPNLAKFTVHTTVSRKRSLITKNCKKFKSTISKYTGSLAPLYAYDRVVARYIAPLCVCVGLGGMGWVFWVFWGFLGFLWVFFGVFLGFFFGVLGFWLQRVKLVQI